MKDRATLFRGVAIMHEIGLGLMKQSDCSSAMRLCFHSPSNEMPPFPSRSTHRRHEIPLSSALAMVLSVQMAWLCAVLDFTAPPT